MLAGEGTIREKSLYNVFPCSLRIPIVVVQFPYFSIVFSIIPIVPFFPTRAPEVVNRENNFRKTERSGDLAIQRGFIA